MQAKRLGNQTPTQSRFLDYDVTRGPEAVELYNASGRTAQEWQEGLLNNIMSINEEGLWVHQKVGYSLPRRNGKNEVITMRELWGLVHGEAIFHTAHRTTTSHTAWERLVKLLKMSGFEELGRARKGEEPPEMSFRTTKQYGLESITMTGGGTANFRTRTNNGGLGEGYDLLVIDEAQEYTLEQESTLTYVVSDSMNPQTILCGTPPTMVSGGSVFSTMRDNIFSGNDTENGWAEWGVLEEPKNIRDKELWYKTNPSLGTILTERKITAEIGQDTLDFVIQRLGYWFKYSLKSAITREEWESLGVCGELPEFEGRLSVGIKYGVTDENVALSVAVRTTSGDIFVECIDCRPVREGNAWIVNWIKNLDVAEVVIDGKSGQDMLEKELIAVRVRNIIKPKVPDVISAMALFERAINEGIIRHNSQPSLTECVSNCEKRSIGSNGGFGYKSINENIDIALLDATALALWSCANAKVKIKQKVRY